MTPQDEWLWGWDPTPGIVSVWAEPDGRAFIWRRVNGRLIFEHDRFRPWVLLDRIDDLGPPLTWRELEGPGALRYFVSAPDGRTLASQILRGACQRLRRPIDRLRDLGQESILVLPPDEQYLALSGRTYFRGLAFDDLHRLQFD